MTAFPQTERPARRDRPARRREPWRLVARRGAGLENGLLAWLVLTGLTLTVLILLAPEVVPLNSLVLPLLVGSLMLSPRSLPWFVVFFLVMLAIAVAGQYRTIDIRTGAAVGVMVMLGVLTLLMSFRRSRLGVAGVLGESMLVDLRDRILGHGVIPALPETWYVESALRSAGGTPFAGDFIVTANPHGDRLEVAVVDVSGKGEQAGTRALLLSGAMGGLLNALPPADFLPAANDYLMRQNWTEGFATAVHLSLDLGTGAYELRTAGHPPAVHLTAGSGRWTVVETQGPVLGLMERAEFSSASGVLRRGDAMLLYTDGMVETPTRDVDLGIDRMLGQAERLLRGNYNGGAARLVEALGSKHDDRALLLVHRR
ncbi:PP2C family protein-serine/threonine phosphatase [Nocardioides sp.]|uniref:PP2C family protein-serine/threonine phosphatase n=1 Tax=Nocardioides sp. TaxID=35761 RepID=UPI0035692274